ncbi:TolC family protein [Anaeromyxobacter sp. Fw109-5]|uniref:TolC family protein n=1 Tax=Anaeromyxobacter sp. (strain Fw109-5) TaxID=404589 RepID=UPI0000ED6D4B|nr:TolC family protein [Anaeromyxobacter sp. Fw109-5]ABS28320.1 outer membrane efflux protein [Anaeromyxobacter sp. Fw109-5]
MNAVTAVTMLVLAAAQAQEPAPSAAPAPQPEQAAPPAAQEGGPQRPSLDAQPAPQPAPAGEIITLQQALGIAASRNLDLKALDARLRQADEASAQAWAGFLPQLTASGRYTRNERESSIPEGAFDPGVPGVRPPSPKITIVPKDQLTGQLEATQVLFSPALWFGIRAAHKGEAVARHSIENARRDLLFGVAQAYYGVAALKQSVEVTERLLEIARRQESDARVRYQAGTIAKVGYLRAEIDRARAEQDLRRSRNSYESARIALATLLDRPVDFEVTDPPEPDLPPDLAQLEEAALRHRNDVQAARRNVELQRASRNASWGRYFPDVAAFGLYQGQNAAGFSGQETAWAAGVGLSWTLLDGGLRESQLREGNAKVAEAEASAASTEALARREVRQAILDLESARANAAKAREQRDLAAENQRLVDVSYRAGAATAVEQADATAELRNSEIAVTTESLSAQLAAVRLLQVAGEFDPFRRLEAVRQPAQSPEAAVPAPQR